MGTELATWTAVHDYRCLDCGHQGRGRITVEERTHASWSDHVCDECESSELEWDDR